MALTRANRFGITFLSKEHSEEAVNQELMAKKSLGMVYIKTPDGFVISFDKLSRRTAHMNYTEQMATNLDVKGMLYELEFPTLDIPCMIVENESIIPTDNPIIISTNNWISNLYLNLDVEALDATNEATPDIYEPNISCKIERANNESIIETLTVTNIPLRNFNTKIWDFKPISGSSDIRISELTIHPNENQTNAAIKYMLCSCFCVCKRGN